MLDKLYGNVDVENLQVRPICHNHLNWVFDLETLGTAQNCIVTEVSAVGFDILSGKEVHSISLHLDIDDQVALGRVISASTMSFWLMQPEEAREKLLLSDYEHCVRFNKPRPASLAPALITLSDTILKVSEAWALDNVEERRPEPLVWGNGIYFDIGKMHSLYESANLKVFWKYWAERDARTLMDLMPQVKAEFMADFQGIKHYGLDDCRHELRYLVAGYRLIKGLADIQHEGKQG